MLLINATQHKQTLEIWNQLGVDFENPDFVAWGVVSPQTPMKQVVRCAWAAIQDEWYRVRSMGLIPAGILIGGYAPLCIPIVGYCFAQALPPVVVVAVTGPAPVTDGERRGFVLSGWRVLPPQGVITKEGSPLPPKQNSSYEEMVHVSSRPLVGARLSELQGFSTSQIVAPVSPILPPQPGLDISSYEEECVNLIMEAAKKNRGVILFDGPPVETAIRIALLARSMGLMMKFVRTGTPPEGSKIPPVVGIETILPF